MEKIAKFFAMLMRPYDPFRDVDVDAIFDRTKSRPLTEAEKADDEAWKRRDAELRAGRQGDEQTGTPAQ